MVEETKVKSERQEARTNVKTYMGRTGRGDNQDRNQRSRKTMEKFVRNTTEKLFLRTEEIRGHIFERTSFGQANQYQKTLKEIDKYDDKDFNSNVRKSIEMLKIAVLYMPSTKIPHTADNETEVAFTKK